MRIKMALDKKKNVINMKEQQLEPSSSWYNIFNMDDQLNDEEKLVRDTVYSYAQEKLMNRILESNRNETFDKSIFTQNPSGIILTRLSINPPPVIFAHPFKIFLSISFRTSST